MYDGLLPLQASSRGSFVITPLRERTGALLAGEADCTVRDILRAALAALAADGAQDIHLDLTGLGFMDVGCTRELINFARCHPAVRFVVYHPPASMRRITAILHPEVTIEFIDTSRPGTGEANGHQGQAASRWAVPAASGEPSAPDIMELVLAEHIRIGQLIAELDRALEDGDPAVPGSGPALAWAALARFLEFHLDAAGEITYRALAGGAPGATMAIARAAQADADVRAAVGEARLARPGSRSWLLAVEAASSAAKRHITCLESGPLPRYRHLAAPGARRVLGRQWAAFMTSRALDASVRLPDGQVWPGHVATRP